MHLDEGRSIGRSRCGPVICILVFLGAILGLFVVGPVWAQDDDTWGGPAGTPRAAQRAEGARPTKGKVKKKFWASRIWVDGATIYPPSEFQADVAHYEGREVTLADLKQLASTIERRYRDNGYFLARVTVPAQRLSEGEIRLLVVEGRFGNIVIENNQHYPDEFIRDFFAPAMAYGAVREGPLQKALLVLNDHMDLRVQSVLVKGKTEGTTDVVLKVTDRRPIHFALDYNNFGNASVGRNRAGISVNAGNVWTVGDGVLVRGVFPFPGKSDPFLSAHYSAPADNRGRRVSGFYSGAATTAGRDLEVLDIRGTANIYGLSLSFPTARNLNQRQDLTFTLVSKAVRNTIFGQLLNEDQLRLFQVGLGGTYQHGRQKALAGFQLTQALGEAFGGTPDDSPSSSRVGAGNSFTKISGDSSWMYEIGPGQFFQVRGQAQFTGDPLPVPEQFSVGGPDSVRGFAQSEYLADDGYALSVDYRLNIVDDPPNTLQLAIFADHGGGDLKTPLPGEVGGRSMTGVGVGLRAQLFSTIQARMDVAFPVSPDKNALGERAIVYAQVSTRL